LKNHRESSGRQFQLFEYSVSFDISFSIFLNVQEFDSIAGISPKSDGRHQMWTRNTNGDADFFRRFDRSSSINSWDCWHKWIRYWKIVFLTVGSDSRRCQRACIRCGEWLTPARSVNEAADFCFDWSQGILRIEANMQRR
jgi:hypothetical protein